jgi:hypothetical protein
MDKYSKRGLIELLRRAAPIIVALMSWLTFAPIHFSPREKTKDGIRQLMKVVVLQNFRRLFSEVLPPKKQVSLQAR